MWEELGINGPSAHAESGERVNKGGAARPASESQVKIDTRSVLVAGPRDPKKRRPLNYSSGRLEWVRREEALAGCIP